jgi:hypothetical protein
MVIHFSFFAVIDVFAAPMVQHIKEMVLEVIKNTSANIYIKISSIYLSLQSPVVKRCFESLFQPHLAENTAPLTVADKSIAQPQRASMFYFLSAKFPVFNYVL